MNRKWMPLVLVMLLALILFFVKRYSRNDTNHTNKKVTSNNESSNSDINRNRGFDRRVAFLEYTEHARCRMQCRKISQAEVEDIMKSGNINYTKSDVHEKPCPTYALEGITNDRQRVRIVFAQCDFKTKVVTVIDLETDWECHCPGDDSKHINKRK